MNIISFLQLIRWKNLLMIAFIQLLFKFVYFPVFSVSTTLSKLDFAILLFATIAIAAAGYVINDVYDLKSDIINKPDKVIIDKFISRKQAYISFFFSLCLSLSLSCEGLNGTRW